MKYFQGVLVAMIVLIGGAPEQASAMVGSAPAVTFSDGSVAQPEGHCGDTDLCATIVYTNGDKLSIYSEGAAYCQPYILHFVRTNGSATIYEYSRTINHDPATTSAFGMHCGNSQTTQMVLDRGLIHMTVSENHDGTLSVTFSAADPKP